MELSGVNDRSRATLDSSGPLVKDRPIAPHRPEPPHEGPAPTERLTAESLFLLVYDQLRLIAESHLRRERHDHTLQPTALVHEAYLKLAHQDRAQWRDADHFLAVAAEAVRRVLIDYARARCSQKRGGGRTKVELRDDGVWTDTTWLDLLALDEAIERLERLHPRQAQLVRLRLFGGMTLDQSFKVLGVSRATAANDWATARAWLSMELNAGGDAPVARSDAGGGKAAGSGGGGASGGSSGDLP